MDVHTQIYKSRFASRRASFVPCLSMISAALSVSNLACSISIRDCAICCCTTPWCIGMNIHSQRDEGFQDWQAIWQNLHGNWFAKRSSIDGSLAHHLHSSLSHSNQSHTVVYTSRSQSPLCYLKSSALACENQVYIQ